MTTETMFLDAAVATHGAAVHAVSGHGLHGLHGMHGMHGAAGCHSHHPLWFALAVLVIGFFITRAIVRGVMRRRYGYGYGGWGGFGPRGSCRGGAPYGFDGPPGFHGHHGHHGAYAHRGSPLHALFRRLDTSASQEKVIREAIDTFRTEAGGVREAMRAAREPFGQLVEAEAFDVEAADALFAAPDAKLRALRETFTRSLGEIHAVLTPSQRKELGSWLRRGPGFGFFRRPRF